MIYCVIKKIPFTWLIFIAYSAQRHEKEVKLLLGNTTDKFFQTKMKAADLIEVHDVLD